MNVYSEYEVVKRSHKKYGTFKMLFRPGWFLSAVCYSGKVLATGKEV